MLLKVINVIVRIVLIAVTLLVFSILLSLQ